MPSSFRITTTKNARGSLLYWGNINNEKPFYIGLSTAYLKNRGLSNLSLTDTYTYKPADWEKDFGFWAYFIFPTAMCESRGSFCCLNTYDRARFTFSFFQYAAHVYNGDFVKYLRRLLSLPLAKDYFPDVVLQSGKLYHKKTDGKLAPLEAASAKDENQALMRFFNSNLSKVDDAELQMAARLIHWVMNDRDHIRLQVETAVKGYQDNLKKYHTWYNLQDMPDYICALICDIHHQGRALRATVKKLVDSFRGQPATLYRELLEIGKKNYPSRGTTFDQAVKTLSRNNQFGNRKYNAVSHSFVTL